MRDYHRTLRPSSSQKEHPVYPGVIKEFQLDVPDDWKEQRAVDDQGWVDIPPALTDSSNGKLITVKIKDKDQIWFRFLGKRGYDNLVDKLNSPDALSTEVGATDKGEFFSSVDAVDYDPSGKVRLTHTQLDVIKTGSRVELRAIRDGLEIRPV